MNNLSQGTYPNPFAKGFGAGDCDEMDVVVCAECFDEFDVIRLIAVFS